MTARLNWKNVKNVAVLLALVFGLLALLGLGQSVLDARTEELRNVALQKAAAVRAQGAALAFGSALNEDWQRSKWAAARMAGSNGLRRQEALEALVAIPGRISWAGFADTSGQIIAASKDMLLGADVSGRPWFQHGLMGAYAGDVHSADLLQGTLGSTYREPVRFLDLALPVRDAHGAIIGVLGVHIDSHWAQTYLDELAKSLKIDLLLLDKAGHVSLSAFVDGHENRPIRLFSLGEDVAAFVPWSDGSSYVTVLVRSIEVADLPSFGWRLVARIEPDALSDLGTPANGQTPEILTGSLVTSLQMIFAVLAAIALALGAVAFFFSHRANKSQAEADMARKRLMTSEQRFLALFGTASLPIAILRDDTYGAVNQAAARLLGYRDPAEIVGKTFLDISPEVQADGVRSADLIASIKAELAHGTARFDWLHLKADGTPLLLDILLTDVQTDAGQDVFAVWTDVTAQRAAEETLRDYQTRLERAVAERTEELEATHTALRTAKDQSDQMAKLRSDFLATMSHEIRGPLNSLNGFVELAFEGAESRQQQGFLSKALQSGRHLARIVDDVLDLSRAEAGRLYLERIEFDLADFAHSTLEAIEPALRQKPVELVFDLAPDLPSSVQTDPLRLRQILMNYLTNAAKFTHEGEIVLRIERIGAGESTALRFMVEDTGIGLLPEQKLQLFQSFSQADVTTARLYGGSGLGLSICQQLATLMEGQVGFDSEAGRGSRFWFDLPVDPLAAPARHADGMVAGRTVWLGLSNPKVRDNLRLWLQAEGFKVAEIGPVPPANSRDAIFVFDPAARRQNPWLGSARLPHRFVLVKTPTETPDGPKQIKTPLHPRQLIEMLRPMWKVAETSAPISELPKFAREFKVLVADDDELNRDLAIARLTRLGLSVRIAVNGADALRSVLDEHFDLILMDHNMPVINGIEATRRIRALPMPRGRTPIVGVSGSDRQEVRQACEAAGMSGFVLKPLSNASLTQLLQAHLPL